MGEFVEGCVMSHGVVDPTGRGLCVLCSQPLAGRSISHLADGRAVCRGCFDRTRLHRAAAKVEAIPGEPALGMPAQSVCSAIHQSLDDVDDASSPGSMEMTNLAASERRGVGITRKSLGAQKAESVVTQRDSERAVGGTRASLGVELKPSILRRAIDAWLGRSKTNV